MNTLIKTFKAISLVLAILFALNTILWFFNSEKLLFSQSINKIQLSETFSKNNRVRYLRDFEFVVCSNIGVPDEYTFLNNPTNSLELSTCTDTDTLLVLSENSRWKNKEILANGDTLYSEGGGIIILYTTKRNSLPLISKTRIGFHIYETDFDVICDETSLWLFNKWYTVNNESWGLGSIPNCSNESSEDIFINNGEYQNPWKINT